MIPQTYPSVLVSNERAMTVFAITDTTGLVEWTDYIPVKEVAAGAVKRNRYATDGAIAVNVLASASGLQAGRDYIRIYVDNTKTIPWSSDDGGFIPVEAVDGSFVPPVSPTIWNSADKSTRIALSGGDLTIAAASAGYSTARSVASVSAGKFYFEIDRTADLWMFGIANSSALLNNYPGENVNSIGLYRDQVYYGGVGVALTAAGFTGVVGVLVNADARTIQFTNGTTTSTAYGILFAGDIFIAGGSGDTGSLSGGLVLNAGATAFSFAVPSGYTAGFGV